MEDETPPFWLQTSNNLLRADRHRRRRRRSFLINSGVLFAFLLLAAVVFLSLILPSVLSLAAAIFRPTSVKHSWDSLNLLLVLFAIACGFLSRNSNDSAASQTPSASSAATPRHLRRSFSSSSTPRNWYDFPDRKVSGSSSTPRNWYDFPDQKVSSSAAPRNWYDCPDRKAFLRRNSSSYPDLRQDQWLREEDRWRFFDDTDVNAYTVSYSDHLRRPAPIGPNSSPQDNVPPPSKQESFPAPAPQPPPSPPSPPCPPPQEMPAFEEAAAVEEETEEVSVTISDVDVTESETPPPLQPAQMIRRRAKRSSKNAPDLEESDDWKFLPPPEALESSPPVPAPLQRRKRGGSSATKEFLTSLYHQRKRKKKHRHKSLDDFDALLELSPSSSSSSAPPPQPPPPPPPSALKNLFSSKKGRNKKRSRSVPPPQPPSPPPPPLRAVEASSEIVLAQSHLSRIRTRIASNADDNASSGTPSPSPIPPPPPPPPPFRVPEWRFATVRGDFVRLLSDRSSRSGSPDPADREETPTAAAASGGDAAAAAGMFCPSPDVDTKADSFIARFRAGLRLEKINSIREQRGVGPSGLGPGPNPGPDPTGSSSSPPERTLVDQD